MKNFVHIQVIETKFTIAEFKNLLLHKKFELTRDGMKTPRLREMAQDLLREELKKFSWEISAMKLLKLVQRTVTRRCAINNFE